MFLLRLFETNVRQWELCLKTIIIGEVLFDATSSAEMTYIIIIIIIIILFIILVHSIMANIATSAKITVILIYCDWLNSLEKIY